MPRFVVGPHGGSGGREAEDRGSREHKAEERLEASGRDAEDRGGSDYGIRHGVRVTTPGPGTAYDISRALTLASIERRAGTALMLHAGAVCEPDGGTVALVAASGMGKTTAVRVLARHLGYVTDETVAIDVTDTRTPTTSNSAPVTAPRTSPTESRDLVTPDSAGTTSGETDRAERSDGAVAAADPAGRPGGVVRAYPKPLSVIRDPAHPEDKGEHSPDSLGLLPAAPMLRLHCLLLLERSAEPRPAALEEVPLLDALAAVIPQTSSLLMLDRPLQRLAEVVTRAGPARALRYSEIEECVDLVHEALRRPVPAPPWEGETGTVAPQRHFAESSDVADMGLPTGQVGFMTAVVRAPWRDAIHADGETLVIVDQVPVRLSPLGALIWREAREPAVTADLVATAREELGDHPDAVRLVIAAATAMLESGALREMPVGVDPAS